jgi:hypothetical protein
MTYFWQSRHLTANYLPNPAEEVPVQIRSGKGTVTVSGEFTDVVDIVYRVPREHAGWQSVAYKGRRYQLHGGIRTPLFITLTNPIRERNPRDPGEDRSPHYPFKRKGRLGPGPMKETNERAAKWDCECEEYVCGCVGISEETEGRTKTVRIDPAKKQAYNKMYREWVAAGRKPRKRR